ncbi:MAG: glutathione S-transferase domain-containing protein, partial [Arenicella sp.]|nr:glutathione S-transferase domain-containing protein [Arenicella sp.]
LKFRGLNKLSGMKSLVKLIAESRTAMHKHLESLEQSLAESQGPWIVGEQFTLADVGMMVIFERLKEVDWLDVLLIAERPLIQAYWARLQQRPSYSAGIGSFIDPTIAEGRKEIVELKQSDASFRQALTGAVS